MGLPPDGVWTKMPAAPGVTTSQPEAFRWDGGYGHTKSQLAQLKLCNFLYKLRFKSVGEVRVFHYSWNEPVVKKPSMWSRIVGRGI